MATSPTTAPTITFLQTNVGKVIKTAIYIGSAAIVSYLITASTNDPLFFGTISITGLINLLLVFIKHTWFDDTTPNLWSKS